MPAKSKNGSVATIKGRIKRLLGVDASPVDAGIFPPKLLRAAEAKAGFVAIYIVAPRTQKWPISFGLTTDPVATYHSFQKGWWEEHCLHVLLWTPGRPAAERVKRIMSEFLAPKRRFFSRSWYDATVDEAERTLRAAAMQERVSLFDDIEKQRKIFSSAQRAWEQIVGVETIQSPVASNVVSFLPQRGRHHASKTKAHEES